MIQNVMLSLPKHLARIVGVMTLAARVKCFGKLSMTFCHLYYLLLNGSISKR
jgi:hypothetical protein